MKLMITLILSTWVPIQVCYQPLESVLKPQVYHLPCRAEVTASHLCVPTWMHFQSNLESMIAKLAFSSNVQMWVSLSQILQFFFISIFKYTLPKGENFLVKYDSNHGTFFGWAACSIFSIHLLLLSSTLTSPDKITWIYIPNQLHCHCSWLHQLS